MWERIKYKTCYSVEYATEDLIDQAARAVRNMPAIESPKIIAQKMGLDITKQGVTERMLAVQESNVVYEALRIPDLIGYIQRETELAAKYISPT